MGSFRESLVTIRVVAEPVPLDRAPSGPQSTHQGQFSSISVDSG